MSQLWPITHNNKHRPISHTIHIYQKDDRYAIKHHHHISIHKAKLYHSKHIDTNIQSISTHSIAPSSGETHKRSPTISKCWWLNSICDDFGCTIHAHCVLNSETLLGLCTNRPTSQFTKRNAYSWSIWPEYIGGVWLGLLVKKYIDGHTQRLDMLCNWIEVGDILVFCELFIA